MHQKYAQDLQKYAQNMQKHITHITLHNITSHTTSHTLYHTHYITHTTYILQTKHTKKKHAKSITKPKKTTKC